jgi:hypothetical protein
LVTLSKRAQAPGIGQVAPDAEPFQAVEHLLGLRERQQNRTVVAHMHDVVRSERVTRLDGLERRFSHRTQAEDDAWRNSGFAAALRGGDRKGAERQALQFPGVFLEVAREVDAEVVQGEVGDGDAAAEVFEVDDGVLELEELLAAVFQIVHLVAGLVLDDVFLAGGGNIESTIRR